MRILFILAATAAIGITPVPGKAQDDAVAEYLKRVPYQETFDYMMQHTGGDPAKLNTWAAGIEPVIPKAGEDVVVRMNNDTFYKQAYANLSEGPVVLTSENSDPDRFSSFQLMDDRNVNFRNIIRPVGSYVLYFGQRPESAEGELIEAPSELVPVIVRVEVKDPHDQDDVAKAEAVPVDAYEGSHDVGYGSDCYPAQVYAEGQVDPELLPPAGAAPPDVESHVNQD